MNFLKRRSLFAILSQIYVMSYIHPVHYKKGLITLAVLKSLVKGLDHIVQEAAMSDMDTV